jgi:hypothetical protein
VNVDEMQKKLSQKAAKAPEHQFEDLYGLLCHLLWLRVAHPLSIPTRDEKRPVLTENP